MGIPDPITIDPGVYTRLKKINEDLAALQMTMDMFVANCRDKIAKGQAEGRAIWAELGTKHQIDMRTINWGINPQSHPGQIIPLSINLEK